MFFTSAAVLLPEIPAGRLIAPYLGVSLETSTGIIETVLAGSPPGSWAGGRLVDRREPNRLLGPTLLAAGGGARRQNHAGGAEFAVPTALLSDVSPMVAKLRLASTTETGGAVGARDDVADPPAST